MNSTAFAALVAAATGFFYMALKAAKDLDAFLRAVRDGMREFADEQRIRAENKKGRLLRQAKFPAVKSVEGCDFSEVSFPDGYTKDDLIGLGFIGLAQDFVFYCFRSPPKVRLKTPIRSQGKTANASASSPTLVYANTPALGGLWIEKTNASAFRKL